MNNTTKTIASILLAVASSASFAETKIFVTDEVKIGDDFEQGHERSREIVLPASFDYLKRNYVIVQFNVRSTNKSQYNAIYLERSFETVDSVPGDSGGLFCEPVDHNSEDDSAGNAPDKPVLVTYLPFSPHTEVHNNEQWSNGWRSVHAVVHVPDSFIEGPSGSFAVLRICSRDKNGGVDGDLDNFEINDIVVHYEVKDEIDPTPVYRIGDPGPAGGVVFDITDGGRHGLEVAPEDLGNVEWGCRGTEITGAEGTAVGTGAQNTADILTGCATPGIAAELANNYLLNGFNDWFLPSKDELNLMYTNLYQAGLAGLVNGMYWSSSENGSGDAWYQIFTNGTQKAYVKSLTLRVRAVRAF